MTNIFAAALLPSLLRSAGALLAVLAAIILLARLAAWQRRRTPTAPAGRTGGGLHLSASLALDRQRRLHLVQCDQAQVLLLVGGAQDLVVGWLPSQAATLPPASPGGPPS